MEELVYGDVEGQVFFVVGCVANIQCQFQA